LVAFAGGMVHLEREIELFVAGLDFCVARLLYRGVDFE